MTWLDGAALVADGGSAIVYWLSGSPHSKSPALLLQRQRFAWP